MPNPYFQFKQFVVHQDRCAMKVCTDACLFGAWFAGKIASGSKVLDIGAGTGLLTLMLAQKADAHFDAIERDTGAYGQMQENIEQCKWKDRIRVLLGDVLTYPLTPAYDFIICNPPFYENDLKSGDKKKNLAKHDTGLTLETLIHIIDQYLSPNGSFGILLPFHRTSKFELLASEKGFHLCEKLLVRQTTQHHFFRSILHFTRKRFLSMHHVELSIKEKDGKYSNRFTNLLKDYYLNL